MTVANYIKIDTSNIVTYHKCIYSHGIILLLFCTLNLQWFKVVPASNRLIRCAEMKEFWNNS